MKAVVRGVRAAVRGRPKILLTVAAGVLILELLLPPLVLSLARKPCDYATFNPWLRRLPGYLVSGEVPLASKLEFLPNFALFWVSADSPYGGTEWGFAVTVSDLARFAAIAVLFGLYFALLLRSRDVSRVSVAQGPGSLPLHPRAERRWGTPGGVFGSVTSVLGFSTGGCTVMGCGAPVLPVVGLAFVGLSSGTLALLALVSRVATGLVLLVMTVSVAYLGWRLGQSAGALIPTASVQTISTVR